MSPVVGAVEPDLDAVPGSLPTTLACAGCGYRLPPDEPILLACPMARPGDDIDHVLHRVLHASRLAFPAGEEANPFVRYRRLLHAYHAARANGWSDGDLVAHIERLDQHVAAVDGHGFAVTPFARSEELSRRLGFEAAGGIMVKDETGNVAGSHKARHLFGTLLELELAGDETLSAAHPLAIASCGNAALAAAVVARAAGRRLKVFIPTHADPVVVARLRQLGVDPIVCERQPGSRGDPTYAALRAAIADGDVPFTCQGNLNGLAVEGGETLGWEMVSQLRAVSGELDHVVVQVGGGALASALIQAFSEARELGALHHLPRFHTVQTRAAFPLARAYERLAAHIGQTGGSEARRRELAWAARHRSEFMWPWETEPRSVAGGILDDETYDWLAVVQGMLESGGQPVIVGEPELHDANRLARSLTGIDVDHTGSAGLAGAAELRRRGVIGPSDRVAVLFTGARRPSPSNGEPR